MDTTQQQLHMALQRIAELEAELKAARSETRLMADEDVMLSQQRRIEALEQVLRDAAPQGYSALDAISGKSAKAGGQASSSKAEPAVAAPSETKRSVKPGSQNTWNTALEQAAEACEEWCCQEQNCESDLHKAENKALRDAAKRIREMKV